jgi:hypothetical protein
MRHRFAMAALAIAMGTTCLGTGACAQGSGFPCDAFMKNADGTWSALRNVVIPGPNFKAQQGALFRPNMSIMGMNVAETLDQECPAVAAAVAEREKQVDLTKYADANGSIDVQKLTCDQLANTFQEDADFLGLWAIGWYSGSAKKHAINVGRVKEGVHNIIAYCKANKDKMIVQAIEAVMKDVRR